MRNMNTISMIKTQLMLLVAKAKSCPVVCFFFKNILKYSVWIYLKKKKSYFS